MRRALSRALAAACAALLFSAPASAAEKKDGPAIDPSLKITVEPVGLIAGGKRHGIYSAQQVELDTRFDLDKLAGMHGLTAHTTFVNRSGENASLKLLGDNLFQSQAVYGGTHHAPVHLVQAYLEEKTGKFDLAGGRLPVGEAFATSPLYCDFMNTAVCGYPFALGAKQGFSVFPNSTWGARVKYAPSKQLYVQTGAYQVRPKAGGRWGFDWGWSGTTGTYIPVEMGWQPKFGSDSLIGHYKLGVALDTSTYPDDFADADGHSFVLSGRDPRRDNGRYSGYVLVDQMLSRHGEGDRNGLIAFGGLVRSRTANSQVSASAFFGLVDQGLLPGRPKDSAGIVFSYARISDDVVATQRIQDALGLPLLDGAHGVQSHEDLVEVRYDAAISDHLHVMPDLQYVLRPGATAAHRNGLLGALRVTATF